MVSAAESGRPVPAPEAEEGVRRGDLHLIEHQVPADDHQRETEEEGADAARRSSGAARTSWAGRCFPRRRKGLHGAALRPPVHFRFAEGKMSMRQFNGAHRAFPRGRGRNANVCRPGTDFQIGKIEVVASTGTYVDSPFHRYASGVDLAGLRIEQLADLDTLRISPRCPPTRPRLHTVPVKMKGFGTFPVRAYAAV